MIRDDFEGPLHEAWQWQGRSTEAPQLRYGQLAMRVGAAGIFRGDARDHNLLLRSLPAQLESYCVEVDLFSTPSNLYENAGLVLFGDEDNYLVLTKEAFPDQRDPPLILRAFAEIAQEIVDDRERTYSQSQEVRLRLRVSGNEASAEFREALSGEWTVVGSVRLPAGPLRIGLQAGYAGEGREVWVEFDDFAIRSDCPRATG